MNDIYEGYKSKSKFLKIIEQITNMSGAATASGAIPGAAPGALPGTRETNPTGTTAAVSPALAKAQKDVQDAQKKAQVEQKKQAQMEINALQTRMKQLQDVLKQKY